MAGEGTGVLEREAELEAFDRALARARAGAGSLLVVEAHPGLGKTTLLGELRRRAEADFTVLSARGGPTEQTFAFGLALQLYEPWLRSAEPGRRQAALAGMAALAAPLFDPDAPLDDDRGARNLFSTLHGLYWLTATIAEERPLLLLLDDAQWSDEPSLRFALYLAQRIAELPVICAVAARTHDPSGSQELLTGLHSSPAAVALEPQPLSEVAVAHVVREDRADADDALVRAIYQATRGNPFLLRELLLTMRSDTELDPANPAGWARELLPDAVSRHVAARLERLPESAAAAARAVAVLGDASSPADAAELAGIDFEQIAEELDRLERADILATGPPLGFVHPLIRSAVYSAIPPAQRADAHGRAAGLLMRHSPEERVVPHLLLASRRGDENAVRALRKAASRALAQGAPHAACTYLRRALDEPPAGEVRGEVLVELADAEVAAGELTAAVSHFEEALERIGEDHRRAEIGLRMGRAQWFMGEARTAAETFARARGHLEVEGGAGRNGHESLDRSLQAAHAAAALIDLELQETGARELENLLATANGGVTTEERELLAVVASRMALTGMGPRDRAVDMARRALADGALLAAQTSESQVFYLGVMVLALSDELDAARIHVCEALEDSRRRGSVIGFANASYTLGGVHYYTGALRDSIGDLEAALAMQQYGWEMLSVSARGTLAHAQIEVGEIEEARSTLCLTEDEGGTSIGWPQFLLARARLRQLDGDHEDALADLMRCGELLAHFPNPAHAAWRSFAALLHLQLGGREEAERLAAEEVALARDWGAPRPLARALRSLGLAQGGEDGLATLTMAVQLLEDSPARLERARTLTDLGAALRRAGQRRAAREPLALALELAEQCGAMIQRDLALEELRATGARAQPKNLAGAASLTPSELRVARMAADGRTNREIAAALFVTVKAVEWHLRNAYRKLQISSRKDLVEQLQPDPGA